jgi:alpha/beta superfamily hydrolase
MSEERLHFPVVEERFELEGILTLPEGATGPVPAVVICHPHPLYGGDMYNDVVLCIQEAVLARGIAALRFNFRGTGRSGGDHAGGYEEREDVFSALDELRRRGEVIDPHRLGLAGYSFGAAVALNAAPATGTQAICAVSPPPQMLDFTAQIGTEIPVLLLAGSDDPIAPAERIQQLPAALGPHAQARIVAGADHFWWGHQEELAALVGAFFAEHLVG